MTPPEVDRIAPPPRDKAGLPDVDETPAEDGAAGDEPERSLRDDVEALIDDGKTYLEAELAYQKTRAAFVAEQAKGTLVFGAAAALLGFLALIGLTVGLIIALTQLLTAWGASGLVVALLLIGALFAARAAGQRWNGLMAAIDSDKGPTAKDPPA